MNGAMTGVVPGRLLRQSENVREELTVIATVRLACQGWYKSVHWRLRADNAKVLHNPAVPRLLCSSTISVSVMPPKQIKK